MFEIIVTNGTLYRVLETAECKPTVKHLEHVRAATLEKYAGDAGQSLWSFAIVRSDNRKLLAVLSAKVQGETS